MWDIKNGKFLVMRQYSWTDRRCVIQVMSRQFKDYNMAVDWKKVVQNTPDKSMRKNKKKVVFVMQLKDGEFNRDSDGKLITESE